MRQVAKIQIGDMFTIALTLVVAAVGTAFGINVLADVRDGFTAGSAEYNATQNAVNGVSKLPEKLPLIGTVVVAAIVIGLLVRFLAFRG